MDETPHGKLISSRR